MMVYTEKPLIKMANYIKQNQSFAVKNALKICCQSKYSYGAAGWVVAGNNKVILK